MSPVPPGGLQIATPDDTSIVLTRTFRAPRTAVWEAFFTPDKMRRWMLPPPGWTLTACDCDARTGGALKLAWKSPDQDPVMTLQGAFTEVLPFERAVHTETMVLPNGQVVGSQVEEHAFTEQDGVTTLRITQTYPSKEARDEALQGGMMVEGMEAQYRQLESQLG